MEAPREKVEEEGDSGSAFSAFGLVEEIVGSSARNLRKIWCYWSTILSPQRRQKYLKSGEKSSETSFEPLIQPTLAENLV